MRWSFEAKMKTWTCFNSLIALIRMKFACLCVFFFFFSSLISFYILRELDLVSKSRSYSAIAQQHEKIIKERKRRKYIVHLSSHIYSHHEISKSRCDAMPSKAYLFIYFHLYMLTMCIQLCNDHIKKHISFTNIRICLFMGCSTIDIYTNNKTTKKCFKC